MEPQSYQFFTALKKKRKVQPFSKREKENMVLRKQIKQFCYSAVVVSIFYLCLSLSSYYSFKKGFYFMANGGFLDDYELRWEMILVFLL